MALEIRPAVHADRARFEAFRCAQGDDFAQDVEDEIVGGRLLDHALGPAQPVDLRVLVVEDDGRLIAICAHHENCEVALRGVLLDGSELLLLALSIDAQGTRQPDGRPTLVHAVELMLDDVRSRDRGPWMTMQIHPANEKMLRFWRRQLGDGLLETRWHLDLRLVAQLPD